MGADPDRRGARGSRREMGSDWDGIPAWRARAGVAHLVSAVAVPAVREMRDENGRVKGKGPAREFASAVPVPGQGRWRLRKPGPASRAGRGVHYRAGDRRAAASPVPQDRRTATLDESPGTGGSSGPD